MVKVKFLDGSVREFHDNIEVSEIASSISNNLKKTAVAAYVDGELYDLNRQIKEDCEIKIITKKEKDGFGVLNHSSAHLLAAAVKELYPNSNFGVGPNIEEGFYYDINTNGESISEDDLKRIEKKMREIASKQHEITREEVCRDEALARFKNDKYKIELINALPIDEVISIYKLGDFYDLCRGGHIGNTKFIKNFKLLSIAGAYWRGDSNNEQLQRIYGCSFYTKDDLFAHLEILKERKERDHRKLGKELEIFDINPHFGQGLVLWLPNGFKIRKALEDYVYDLELRNGYQHIATPVIGSKKLYETSGHWEHYSDNMFPLMVRGEEEMVLRPMSCPHHMLVYKTKLRSYRDLPIRYSETVIQNRYEASGALTGLERVRGMTLTDAHLFVREDQIKEEVIKTYALIQKAIKDLGLSIDYVELALRDEDNEKYHQDDKLWNQSESMLEEILEEIGVDFVKMKGEAAFYGPKIDIQVKTSLNHIITMSTIQLDFLLPIKFDLEYIGSENNKERPIVIHRGLISTYERLMSILLEQYKGAFPLWIAPTQINIIPVSNSVHIDFVKELHEKLLNLGIRSEIDSREEKLGYKIRESSKRKIPYTLVLGDEELASNSVTYRKLGSTDQNKETIDNFIQLINKNISEKK